MTGKQVKSWLTSLVIRKTQIKITMRYHDTLTRMAKMKQNESAECWLGCRATMTAGEKANIAKAVLENFLSIFTKVKYIIHTPLTQHLHFCVCISNRNVPICSSKDFYVSAYRSTVLNSPKGNKPISIKSKVDKHWYTYFIEYYKIMRINEFK